MFRSDVPRDLLTGWTVLVVDDDAFSLDIASILLEHYGATVHTATNGQEGLEAARKLHPRFVLADISMPLMDGWTMVEQLQRDVHTRSIPVIALTAHAMRGHREKALAMGFYNYLTKPLTPETFMTELVNLLMSNDELSEELSRRAG